MKDLLRDELVNVVADQQHEELKEDIEAGGKRHHLNIGYRDCFRENPEHGAFGEMLVPVFF